MGFRGVHLFERKEPKVGTWLSTTSHSCTQHMACKLSGPKLTCQNTRGVYLTRREYCAPFSLSSLGQIDGGRCGGDDGGGKLAASL